MGMNGTMMQYFQWDLPADASLWKALAEDAAKLKTAGVTAVWLPPAYKGAQGKEDVGYGVYDLYDLGEFNQKGSVPTKYGTKAEYLAAIKALHDKKIQVYADIVLNHRIGADEVEQVSAEEFNANSRNQMVGDSKTIGAWTKFTFPGRKGKYSDLHGTGHILMASTGIRTEQSNPSSSLREKTGTRKWILSLETMIT